MVYMETPYTVFGTVWPDMPPHLTPLQGVVGDFAIQPYKPSSFTPDGWFAVYMVGVGNLYEGPGPVRVFEAA